MVDRPDPTPRSPGKAARAAVALAQGRSIRATAAELEIGERTLRRWSKAPTFKARVDRLRAEMMDEVIGGLTDTSRAAVAELARLIRAGESDAVKLAACRAVLDKLPLISEYHDMAERVRAMEEQRGDRQGDEPGPVGPRNYQ